MGLIYDALQPRLLADGYEYLLFSLEVLTSFHPWIFPQLTFRALIHSAKTPSVSIHNGLQALSTGIEKLSSILHHGGINASTLTSNVLAFGILTLCFVLLRLSYRLHTRKTSASDWDPLLALVSCALLSILTNSDQGGQREPRDHRSIRANAIVNRSPRYARIASMQLVSHIGSTIPSHDSITANRLFTSRRHAMGLRPPQT